MKKFLIVLLLFFTCLITSCEKDSKKVVVAEVTHSPFYAPQYVALSEGIFEKYDLNVEIILASGADKVMATLLSGDADIGLMGPEASIYVYNQGRSDYAITFAQLTQKDGSFIVGREKIENFTLEDLKGKSILAGRLGGMPYMTLEYVLKEANLNPKENNINLRTDIAFAAQMGAFVSGEGDFTTLFEPLASTVELEGKGYVLKGVGEYTDNVAYTTYQTLNSYLTKNNNKIDNFTKAISEALVWTKTHSAHEIALSIHKYFQETNIDILTKAVERYKYIGAWSNTPYLDTDEFKHLQDIIIASGELDKYLPYELLVINKHYDKR